ncbi:MAG: hypothetical protein RI907_2974, partial [Pseudomonadota bacterium]
IGFADLVEDLIGGHVLLHLGDIATALSMESLCKHPPFF